jgi:hypothetical protein
MDPGPLLLRILAKPTAEDLIALQGVLLAREEAAASPAALQKSAVALGILEDFHAYLVGLESKLEARAFSEVASRMDMCAVGGVVAENVLAAGEKLMERILIGGLSEALMVLASRQYVKAFNRDLDAFYRQVAWQLRAHLWRFSAARRPEMESSERARLIDSLLVPLMKRDAAGAARPIVFGWLFQILLLGSVAEGAAA